MDIFDKLFEENSKQLGIDDLPIEMQAEFQERLGSLMFDAISRRSLEQMSEEEQDEFLMLSNNEEVAVEDLLTYLEEHTENYPTIVSEECSRIMEGFLSEEAIA